MATNDLRFGATFRLDGVGLRWNGAGVRTVARALALLEVEQRGRMGPELDPWHLERRQKTHARIIRMLQDLAGGGVPLPRGYEIPATRYVNYDVEDAS